LDEGDAPARIENKFDKTEIKYFEVTDKLKKINYNSALIKAENN
jgi:hypothetical protein